jgi:hypothetical protein
MKFEGNMSKYNIELDKAANKRKSRKKVNAVRKSSED